MGNEVVRETKDAAADDCCNKDNGISLLSLVESAGRGVANAVQKVEDFGSGVVAGGSKAVGLNLDKGTCDLIAKGAILGLGAVAADQAIKHPAEAAAIIVGGATGAAGAAAIKAAEKVTGTDIGAAAVAGAVAGAAAGIDCATKCAEKVGTDAAIGAAIGAAAGLATGGDITRTATLAAMGAITGAAARCAVDMCKPSCCIPTNGNLQSLKDIGGTVIDHVKNRPYEAAAETLLGGPAGLLGGAVIRDTMEQKSGERLVDKVMKNTCNEIRNQAEMMKSLLFTPPILQLGLAANRDTAEAALAGASAVGNAVIGTAAAGAVAGAAGVGVRAGLEAAKAASELEQHRKDNPTTSAIERGAGYVLGGVIAGKAVGTAIEAGDVGTRKAYKWVKSLFE